VGGIVPDELRLRIRRMPEHLLADGIAESPNVFLRCLEELIDDDVTFFVRLHGGILDHQDIGIRFPSRGDQNMLSHDLQLFSAVLFFCHYRSDLPRLADLSGFSVRMDSHAAGKGCLELFRDLGLFIMYDPLVLLYDRNLRAHGLEEMRELGCNISSADDDHAFRAFRKLERTFVRKVLDALDAFERRNSGSGAGYDENRFALDRSARRIERILIGKMRLTPVVIEIFGLVQRFLDGIVTSFHVLPHPLHNGREIDRLDLCGDPEFLRLADLHDSVGRIGDHLRGYATDVQAGAARWPPVHDGNGLIMCQGIIDKVHPAARADDDDVVFFHGFTSC
jgi:hypothetical protein